MQRIEQQAIVIKRSRGRRGSTAGNDERKAGVAMFASVEQVFELEAMMRFRDPVRRKILEK